MKNVLKIGFVAGLTFFSSFLFGKDLDYTVSLENATSTSINVEIAKEKNAFLSLNIYDETNHIIYTEDIKSIANFNKSYNFKNLSTGIYYIVTESNYKVEKYRIKVKNGKASIDKSPITELKENNYSTEGNHVKFHLDDINEPVRITVTDLSDYEYYSALKNPKNGELEIKFDFNPEISDTYIIKIEKKEETLKNILYLK